MKTLRRLWEKFAAQIVGDEPEEARKPWEEIKPPQGLEMAPGAEVEEFVLRLADGTYYAGPGAEPGAIERTRRIQDAQKFPDRWAALMAASGGIVFAHAAITPVRTLQWPAETAARR